MRSVASGAQGSEHADPHVVREIVEEGAGAILRDACLAEWSLVARKPVLDYLGLLFEVELCVVLIGGAIQIGIARSRGELHGQRLACKRDVARVGNLTSVDELVDEGL